MPRVASPGLRRSANTFLIACLVGLTYLAWRMLLPYLTPIGWAAVFATVGYPVYRGLARWFRGRCRLAALTTCVLLSVVIVVPMVLLGFALARQSIDAYGHLQRGIVSPEFDAWLHQHIEPRLAGLRDIAGGADTGRLRDGLLSLAGQFTSALVSQTKAIVTGFAGFVFSFFLMNVSMYVFFLDGPAIVRRLQDLTPLPEPHDDELIRRFRDVSQATLYGGIATALAQGLVGGIIFGLLGLPSPALWGAAMGVASFIPLVGTALIWGPAAAFLIVTGRMVAGVVLVGLGVGVIGMVDNIIKPLVVRGRMQMPLLLVFLGILGGLQLFGVLGLILGPLVLAMLMTLLELYVKEQQLAESASPQAPV